MEVNKNYNEPCIETMSTMPDCFVSGIITSPPYNMGSNPNHRSINEGDLNLYNDKEVDNLSTEEYLDIRLKEFVQFDRILKNDGVICYNISYSSDSPILPTLLISDVHNKTNLTLADIISWKKRTAHPFQTSPNKLTRLVELVYVFVHKDCQQNFKANKEVSKKNEKTNQLFYKNYTNLLDAPNNDGQDIGLYACFSSLFVRKLINIYFPKDSLIYDPFMGSGTTAVGCIIDGIDFIGSEINTSFFLKSNKLIKDTKIQFKLDF